MSGGNDDVDLSSMLTVGEAAEELGVSVSTLRNWDREGKLVPPRHPMNSYRLYPPSLIERVKQDAVRETAPEYRIPPRAENKFDVPFVSRLAIAEKQIQQAYRPYIQLHKWFARRPGTLFRGLLLSEFVDHSPLQRLFFHPQDLPGTTVFDPFMGGGTPLLEASRMGMNVVGCDINPMAYWIVRQALEPLDLDLLRKRAEEVLKAVGEKVDPYYETICKDCGQPAPVKYFIWVKTHNCAECGEEIELFPGYVMAGNARHPNYVLFCPQCRDLFELTGKPERGEQLQCTRCEQSFENEPVARRNRYTCPDCGHEGRYPTELAKNGPPSHSLLCMEYHCPRCKPTHDGRFFKAASDREFSLFAEASRAFEDGAARHWVPDDEIPEGDETTRLHRWGYQRYRELFNPRQLLSITTLCEEISRVPEDTVRHALATVLSDCLRYQNMLARYDTYALKCQDIFAVHGYPVRLMQCENNVLGVDGAGSGGFRQVLDKYCAAKEYNEHPFEKKIEGKTKRRIAMSPERIEASLLDRMPQETDERVAWLHCGSSESVPLSPNSVDAVVTDPPYYNNVQYAELMDFCYIWLRQLLNGDVPEFQDASTRDESELTGNKNAGRGIAHFTEGLSAVYQRAAEALKPEGLFAFTYHHNDVDAYVPLVVALCDAGLSVTATIPCPAEMSASLHISGTGSSVVDTIICARRLKGPEKRVPASEEAPDTLAEELADQAQALANGDVEVTEGDLRCMALGILTGWSINALVGGWNKEANRDNRIKQARTRLVEYCEAASWEETVKEVHARPRKKQELIAQSKLF